MKAEIERERRIKDQVFVTFKTMTPQIVKLADKFGVKIGSKHYAFSIDYYEDFRRAAN